MCFLSALTDDVWPTVLCNTFVQLGNAFSSVSGKLKVETVKTITTLSLLNRKTLKHKKKERGSAYLTEESR